MAKMRDAERKFPFPPQFAGFKNVKNSEDQREPYLNQYSNTYMVTKDKHILALGEMSGLMSTLKCGWKNGKKYE